MSGLVLKVEGFGGQSVEGLVKEMADTATRLGLWVTCDINGIHVMAAPDDSPETLWRNYQTARERKATFVSANVIPRGTVATTWADDFVEQVDAYKARAAKAEGRSG